MPETAWFLNKRIYVRKLQRRQRTPAKMEPKLEDLIKN